MKNNFLAIFLAGIWITISEFVRNEVICKQYWIDHFAELGLSFETLPINGFFWLLWSMIFAYVVYHLLTKFSLRETCLLAWLFGFVMMWLVVFNLQVLPVSLLIFAIPLSIIEVVGACVIIQGIAIRRKGNQ